MTPRYSMICVFITEADALNVMSNLPVLGFGKNTQLDGLYPVAGSLIGTCLKGSLMECGVQCGMTSDCASLFYRDDTSTCYLHSDWYTTSSTMTSIPRMTYMGKTGCQTGWISHGPSCYYIDTTTMRTFDGAKQYCQSLSTLAYLARIESQAEDDFLKTTFQTMVVESQGFWIGLTDRYNFQTWTWEETQSSPLYTGWGNSQPTHNDEHCAVMLTAASYDWHDAECVASTFYALCKI